MKSIVVALLCTSACAVAALQVTLAPGGSLTAARDAIRAKRQAGAQGPAVITLKDGVYNLTEPLVLEARDSNLTISAAPGAKPLLMGGTVIKRWSAYQGKILKSDVSAVVKPGENYRQLLCGGKRMILARYPNYTSADPLYGGWAFADVLPHGVVADKDFFVLKAQDLRKWAHPEDVEVDIYTGDAYWNNLMSFQSYDPATRRVTLGGSGGYEIKPHSRFHFQNALEELDAPGEWFLDPRTKTLYFWPLAMLSQTEVRLVTLDSFIQIGAEAKNISIEKLSFTGCNGTAITMTNAEDCQIAGCTLTTVGGYRGWNSGYGGAININGGKHNIVLSNEIGYTGGAGVSASGGDRITLTAAGHDVTNNDIHHVGVFGKGANGVEAGGCGVTIAHNVVHDCPRIGVIMGGNKHLVEYNHLYQLCLETNDGGAIYTGGRDWIGGRGTIWRYNRVHDVVGCAQTAAGLKHPAFTFGLYPDDNTGGLDMIGNLVYRCGTTPLHMHNSRDCLVENNVLAFGGSHQFDLQGWRKSQKMVTNHISTMIMGYESVAGQPAWKGMRGMELHPKDAFYEDGMMMSGNVVHRNIMVSNSPTARHAKIGSTLASKNKVEMNLAWNGAHPVNTGFHRTGPDRNPPLMAETFDGMEPGKAPTGWRFTSKTTETTKLIVADNALRADCAAGGTPAVPTSFRSQDIPIKAGASYRVRMRIRSTEPTSRVLLAIAIQKDKAGSWQGKPSEIAATREWQDVEAVASIPAQGAAGWKPWMTDCCVSVQSKESKETKEIKGRIFIDDVRLSEAEPASEWASWQAEGWDKGSIVADPMFEDPAKDDYRLKPESPAIKQLGFQPLPIEKMGLIQDKWRTP